MWRTLLDDLYFRFFTAALVLLHLPYALPSLGQERLAIYTEMYLNLVLLPVVIFSFLNRRRAVKSAMERTFWDLFALSFAFWWIITALHHSSLSELAYNLAVEILYSLFYLTVFLAAECKAHLRREWVFGDILRSLETVGAVSWSESCLSTSFWRHSNSPPRFIPRGCLLFISTSPLIFSWPCVSLACTRQP